jgi:transcriptional regulator with XRE-family HTH domain
MTSIGAERRAGSRKDLPVGAAGRVPRVKKIPNPIDKHVGSRVRMRRILLGLSQERLGEALSLTFQQVQKYEKGTNRIGASRLQQISKVLQVPPSFFFEGAPVAEDILPAGFAEPVSSAYVVDFLSSVEGIQLNKAFASIKDVRVRKRVLDLVIALADSEEAAPPLTD